MSIWAIQILFGYFCWGGARKGERLDLGGMGSECDWVHCMELPNTQQKYDIGKKVVEFKKKKKERKISFT